NLNGAISGRMSSNFQQFPRGAFKTEEGEELYHPRQAFVPDGDYYDEMVFIDFSQIELRVQAHYTLLVNGGDMNLCRAYMPFKCTHYETGEPYDFKTIESRARWDEKQSDGQSACITEEGKPWIPTDVHTATASKAYPHIPTDSDEFRQPNGPRDKGKTTNFASNYGGEAGALIDVLMISWDEAERLVNGYNEAFPGVKEYQQAIVKAHAQKGYVQNHYGRRYYLTNNQEAYRLSNFVVQGSAADALKKAVIEIDKFLLDKATKLVLPIHDELIFSYHMFDLGIEEEIRKIMLKSFDWCLVPVNAGIDTTKTNWREAA